jgi:succinoglycan biosynthesis transport protein ExoP
MRMTLPVRTPALASRLRPMHLSPARGSRERVAAGADPDWTDPAPARDTLMDYWDLLLIHRRTLVLLSVTGLAVAVVIGLAQTPRYRARTSLEIQHSNENFLDLNTVHPTVSGVDLPLGPSYFQTQVVMLQSDTLIERVLEKLNLRGSRPPRFSVIRRMLGLPTSPRPLTREESIRRAKANLTVRAARDARVLEILYESENPNRAADVANTLVGEFIEQNQEMRVKAFQRTAERLTVHLGEMKSKLERAEAQLQEYVRTAGLTFTSEKDNVSDVRLVELQNALSAAQADRIAREARFLQAKKTPADALPEILDDPTLREYRLRLTDLQRQLVELTATLTPAHYKVRRVQAQIDELQAAIQHQRALTLRRVGSEYAAALRRERFLENAYADQQKIVTDLSGKGIRYRTLKGEVDSARRLYEAMLERVKQAELATTMRATNMAVIDAARPPALPYSPNLPVNAAVGLFCGVFLGIGFVFFREQIDRRIQAPGEARLYLNASELGVITAAEAPRTAFFGRTRAAEPILLPAARVDRPSEAEPQVGDRPSPLRADSYRSIATSLLLGNRNGHAPRVVVVTSPCAGDGKTTLASNLSLAVVETGKKVLVIDADLRRPRLHERFGLSNLRGLSDLLCDESPAAGDDALERALCRTGTPGVHVMPAGTADNARMLHSVRFAALLERLRGEFDMIIVDTPPVLPVPDARVLGRLADGVVLVVRAGHTTIESALAVRQRFAEDGIRVLGTVLNGWNPKTGRRYRYGGYDAAYQS